MKRFNVLPTACAMPKCVFGLLALGVAQAQTLPPPPVSPAPVLRLEYDAQGNPTRRVLAPGVANFSTSTGYDRLNRAVLSTDARGKPTQMAYDGRENLLQVTDPRNLLTQYPRNGLGDSTGLVSPDTGVATHTVDAAGNLRTRTDSRGVTATYGYDALNRVTSTVYAQGGQSQSFLRTYDQTGPGFSNGIGRLTSTQFPGGSSTLAYDAQGRLTATTQTVAAGSTVTLGVGYGYDAAGHVTSITYPSGRVLSIAHAGGQPTSLSLAPSAGATALPLLSGLQFEPAPGGVGTLRSWNWETSGGSVAHTRVFDVYGRMVRHPLGGAVRDISYDAADRIASFTHLDAATGQATAAAQALNQAFGYDELGRLTSVATPAGTWAYAYDDNGNRLSQTLSTASGTLTRTSTIASNSNRLLALSNPAQATTLDAAGNTTSINAERAGGWTAYYDLAGRLSGGYSIPAYGTGGYVVSAYSFVHDADGQRVVKTITQQRTCPGRGSACTFDSTPRATVFVHDQQGQLLGEYDGATGAVIREYVWLQDLPVVVVDGPAAAPAVYFVQTDHLGTPRVVLDALGRQRWSWVSEAFGDSAPAENPIGVGAFRLNLRHPGQYADPEALYVYNWNRYYLPGVGRYTQSDPIGLAGGIGTYSYAAGNPLSFIDPAGLWCVYSQGSGRLVCVDDSSGRTYYDQTGYSGYGFSRNEPGAQMERDRGPIPRGAWKISQLYDSRLNGPNTFRLIPLSGNDCFKLNRDCSTFRMHGGNMTFRTSSEGCMIMPPNRKMIPLGEIIHVIP